jgi:hypothetical protein
MRNLAAILLGACWPLLCVGASVPEAQPASNQALRAAYADLRPKLEKNAFGQPLHLSAREEDHRLTGDVHAVLPHSFAEAGKALADATQWCEVLLLPFNIKHCEAQKGASAPLTLLVGRKYSTPIERTHRLEFRFQVAARSADYLRIVLTAPEGPFSTRDYEIVFELAPLDERRSIMHMKYSYAYGNIARAAMRTYLATIGSHKVGFTTEGSDEAGKPALVRGMRGVMERNTMRYYLAIEAYLRSLRAPESERVARMIQAWFESVERHPRQLHELERDEYVPMKQKEFERMHGAVSHARRTASSSPSPS